MGQILFIDCSTEFVSGRPVDGHVEILGEIHDENFTIFNVQKITPQSP